MFAPPIRVPPNATSRPHAACRESKAFSLCTSGGVRWKKQEEGGVGMGPDAASSCFLSLLRTPHPSDHPRCAYPPRPFLQMARLFPVLCPLLSRSLDHILASSSKAEVLFSLFISFLLKVRLLSHGNGSERTGAHGLTRHVSNQHLGDKRETPGLKCKHI